MRTTSTAVPRRLAATDRGYRSLGGCWSIDEEQASWFR
jgi:hypothetical protein